MAHNINSYIGRESAWHQLGTVTGHYMTWGEIQAHGGLNYLPEKQQLFDRNGNAVESWGVFRPDTGAFLGAVGDQYTVIDHAEGFRMIDMILGQQDGAHYETAGCLGKGEVVWGLANLNTSIEVGKNGDKSNVYLLFATAHNGTFSHLYRTTFTRVVCQNTLNAAKWTRWAADASDKRYGHTTAADLAKFLDDPRNGCTKAEIRSMAV